MKIWMPELLGSIALFAAACGGKVVADGQPSGLAGGSGGGSSTSSGHGGAGGNSGAGGATTGSTGSGDATLCAQLCAVDSKACPTPPPCQQTCEASLANAGACKGALVAVAECLIKTGGPSPDFCVISSDCTDAVNAYKVCDGTGVCEIETCNGTPDGSCACKNVCNGANLAVQCQALGNGTSNCVCLKEGSQIGKCQDNTAMSCEFTHGCCAPIFGLGP
jgi:hypothetical protein